MRDIIIMSDIRPNHLTYKSFTLKSTTEMKNRKRGDKWYLKICFFGVY